MNDVLDRVSQPRGVETARSLSVVAELAEQMRFGENHVLTPFDDMMRLHVR